MSGPDGGALALEHIRAGMKNHRMAQAYLLVGPLRTHGLPIAVKILQTLFCRQPASPCGTCSECRRIAERTHPDVHWLEPQKKSRTIAVDDARDMMKDLMKTAYEGGWKAAVIVAADRLGVAGKSEAGNALLKTLEEPPEQTLFLLLTDTQDSILPTIQSRCQRILLAAQSLNREAVWFPTLESILIQPLEVGATLNGLVRSGRLQALLKDRRDAVEKEESATLKDQEIKGEEREELLGARVELRVREERMEMLRVMQAWYRDLLLVGLGVERGLMFPDRLDRLRILARGATYRQALDNIEAIENMQRQFSRNIKEDVVLTLGFSRLAP